jgi:hypothetical protein
MRLRLWSMLGPAAETRMADQPGSDGVTRRDRADRAGSDGPGVTQPLVIRRRSCAAPD